MAKGDGGIIEKKDKDGNSYRPKKWRVIVRGGYDPISKRYTQIERVVTGTKAQAQKVRDQIKRELETGISAEAYKITFNEYAQLWATKRKEDGELQERTYEDDARIISILDKYIGDITLQNLNPLLIEDTYSKIKKEGNGRNGDGYSGTTMHRIHQKLNQILKEAEFKGLISRNPCTRIKAPKINTPNRKALPLNQFKAFAQYVRAEKAKTLEAFNSKENRQEQRGNTETRSIVRGISCLSRFIAVEIGIATGMRIGEILGLIWANIDLQQAQITVSQAITNSGNIKRPKNERTRVIAIDETTVNILIEWKNIQAKALKTIGQKQSKETPACCSDIGTFYGIANFEHWFRRFRVEAGFPELRFHELRHTQATQLLNLGMDIKTVQARLGHSNASTTLNFYAHSSIEKSKEAAAIIEAITTEKEAAIIEFKRA